MRLSRRFALHGALAALVPLLVFGAIGRCRRCARAPAAPWARASPPSRSGRRPRWTRGSRAPRRPSPRWPPSSRAPASPGRNRSACCATICWCSPSSATFRSLDDRGQPIASTHLSLDDLVPPPPVEGRAGRHLDLPGDGGRRPAAAGAGHGGGSRRPRAAPPGRDAEPGRAAGASWTRCAWARAVRVAGRRQRPIARARGSGAAGACGPG